MKELFITIIYVLGMFFSNIYAGYKQKDDDQWDLLYMAISLFSWIGFILIFLIFKIKKK